LWARIRYENFAILNQYSALPQKFEEMPLADFALQISQSSSQYSMGPNGLATTVIESLVGY